MSNFDWGYPNTVWFGNGRIKDLPKACKVLDIKNPLFVTDKDLVKTKMVEETLEINKRAKLPTIIFSDLKGNIIFFSLDENKILVLGIFLEIFLLLYFI